MWVRQLIGRNAGLIVEMAYTEGMQNIANGTASAVSEDELESAGKNVADQKPDVDEALLISDYSVAIGEFGGYDIHDAGGVKINYEPYRNMLEARQAATEHAMGAKQIAVEPKQSEGDELKTLRDEAAALGVKADGRWSKERLRSAIAGAKATASDDDADDSDSDDDESDDD